MGIPLLDASSPDQEGAASLSRSLPASGFSRAAFRQVWRRLAEAGVFELLIPAGPLDAARAVATLEGLAEGCDEPGLLVAVGAHCFGVGAALSEAGPGAHESTLRSLRDGAAIGALAATEAEAGSDVMSLSARYRRSDRGVVLSGEKRFVTNLEEADVFLVLATRDPRQHFRGISAFLVPRDTPGLATRTEQLAGGGLAGCSIGILSLDEVEVPLEALVGSAGGGAKVFRRAMLWERSLIAAAHLGRMRRQLAETLDRARTRRQFGRPIGANQYVAGRLVDMLLRYRTARLLVRDSAERLAAGRLTPAEASLTKLYVSEAATASSLDALRLAGGAGQLSGSQPGSDLSSSLASLVYSGTSELQRVIIAAELGLEG